MTRAEFAARHGLDPRTGPSWRFCPAAEAAKSIGIFRPILEACERLTLEMAQGRSSAIRACGSSRARPHSFDGGRRSSNVTIKRIEGETYDALAAADCAIVASGTATVEAALLGTPMVVVYRVAPLTAFILRRMVHTPFFSMVNLVAGRRIVPELIQDDFTPAAVAAEVRRLLESPAAREEMKEGLADVRASSGRAVRSSGLPTSLPACSRRWVAGNCARISGILAKGNRPFQERFLFCSKSVDCPLSC